MKIWVRVCAADCIHITLVKCSLMIGSLLPHEGWINLLVRAEPVSAARDQGSSLSLYRMTQPIPPARFTARAGAPWKRKWWFMSPVVKLHPKPMVWAPNTQPLKAWRGVVQISASPLTVKEWWMWSDWIQTLTMEALKPRDTSQTRI